MNTGELLVSAMEDSLQSGDIGRMNAVHALPELLNYRDYSAMARCVSSGVNKAGVPDYVDFILVHLPVVPEKTLKLATGKTRDQWADVLIRRKS